MSIKLLFSLLFGIFGFCNVVLAQFSGTKTIGASGADYTSITAALASLSPLGVNGETFLELQNDYVSSGETFPIAVTAITGASAINRITIRPATGVTGSVITNTGNFL